MKNRVKIDINGKDYTIMTDEQPEYVTELAGEIDKNIEDMLKSNSSLTLSASAILLAFTYLDKYTKSEKSAENMREQMKSYVEDASKSNLQLQKEVQKRLQLAKQIQLLDGEIKRLKKGL